VSSRVLGLDIGGTRSRAQLCVDGQVVGEGNAASASPVAVGAARAKVALTDLLAQLPLDPLRRLDAVCVGSAGASVPATRQFLTEHLARLTRSGQVMIVKDAALVLPAALPAPLGPAVCGAREPCHWDLLSEPRYPGPGERNGGER